MRQFWRVVMARMYFNPTQIKFIYLKRKCNYLSKYNVKIEEDGHSDKIFDSHFVIKSPGISNFAEIIKKLTSNGIPVIGEIEFAYQLLNTNNIVAITGSNGKTTTTTMITNFLKNAGLDVYCGGNIGHPLSRIVLEEKIEDESIVVLELSSFQLEDIYSFCPQISIILNVTLDHMDRYHQVFDLYFAAKMRITHFQKEDDFYIYYSDDENLKDAIPRNVQAMAFSLCDKSSGIFIGDNYVWYGSEKLIPLEELNIKGRHNYLNLIAALKVCKIYNLTKDQIFESVKNFQTPEHRLEFVGEIKGTKYYNDSKATNVDSVNMALTAFEEPVILILGGRDKDSDFTLLQDSIKAKVKHLVITGEAAEKIDSQLNGTVDSVIIKNFTEAVQKAHDLATGDDIVLLSPACASFDAFKNYEERGKYFKQLVKGFNK